ncbi:MAG: hypothetical protein AAF654_07930 [Myxococcota bacterium]
MNDFRLSDFFQPDYAQNVTYPPNDVAEVQVAEVQTDTEAENVYATFAETRSLTASPAELRAAAFLARTAAHSGFSTDGLQEPGEAFGAVRAPRPGHMFEGFDPHTATVVDETTEHETTGTRSVTLADENGAELVIVTREHGWRVFSPTGDVDHDLFTPQAYLLAETLRRALDRTSTAALENRTRSHVEFALEFMHGGEQTSALFQPGSSVLQRAYGSGPHVALEYAGGESFNLRFTEDGSAEIGRPFQDDTFEPLDADQLDSIKASVTELKENQFVRAEFPIARSLLQNHSR